MDGAPDRARATGIDALADVELVALVLGTGSTTERVHVLAQALLDDLGGVQGLARAGIGELAARRGLGRGKAERLAAATELGKRLHAAALRRDGAVFSDADVVDAWARPRLATLEHEELWALALDGRNRLRAARRIAVGGLHGLHVQPRDVLRAMVREGASAFVLVHNHPSGDPTPSTEDLKFTERIVAAGETVATPLVDHVVIGSPGYMSLLNAGLFPLTRKDRAAERRPASGDRA
ncbi:MAG: DNA repair protein RadC [Polyangiaceae bacterium]